MLAHSAANRTGSVYTAAIPAAAFKAGDMVRWAVVATAPGGLSTREPDPQAKEGDYKGTVIPGPLPANSLPVLYW